MRKIITYAFAFAFMFTAGVLCAKLLQCPKCGYEYQEGLVTCPHCGATLPAVQAAPPAAVPAAVPAITDEIMKKEILAVAKSLAGDAPALVILKARNTLALLKIAPAVGGNSANALLDAITSAEGKLRDTKINCFACRGTGQRTFLMADMRGDIRQQSGVQNGTAGTGCPVCNGTGKLPARTSQTVIVSAMSEAKQEFEREQQARGWEDFAGIWLPKGLAEHLAIRQKAALKTSIAATCTTCYGFGFFGCSTCNGDGKLKCTNIHCVQGREPCTVCKGKGKVMDKSSTLGSGMTARGVAHICPACGGTGIATCSICGGRAWLPCTKCESTGQIRCTVCKGTGENDLCQKCDGSGIAPCINCKGTGEVRGQPCPVCHGEKEVFCTICNGTGHKLRTY